MTRYAIIENGVVGNVALWDGATEWADAAGAIPLPEDSPVGPGYTYDGTAFTAPAQPVDTTT